jgi:transaldolase / glucose-6-phosphate isomerase
MPSHDYDALVETFLRDRIVQRIWERDPTIWGATDPAPASSIRNRLGWLDAPRAMRAHVDRIKQLAQDARDAGVRTAYLLGMGGSSLCAEVLRTVYGVADSSPELVVLDTTDDETLSSVASRLDHEHTLFIVASKSGTTIEIASMERFFWRLMQDALGDRAGRHFLAITDPGTALEALARERGYRETFINPPDIGGRFSALSLFGLVPAALIGAPIEDFLDGGVAMAEGCREARRTNAGLELGAFMGAAGSSGRDKLTVLLPHSLASLGLWIEQLVAESTGKRERGLLPVVDEPPGGAYGRDRAFVAIETENERLDEAVLDAIDKAGHPLFRIRTRHDALGAEFFRWEFATAVAGAALQLNPFDEPNVTEAKDRTKALLTAFERDRRLPDERAAGPAEVRTLIESMGDGDYFAVLSYLPPESPTLSAIDELRAAIRSRGGYATTFGIGPRYLHSTGQYHKGGPATGVFLVITADDRTTTKIPSTAYSFSILKRAQALGDYQALTAHGRRVARVHLTGADHRRSLEGLIAEALAAAH